MRSQNETINYLYFDQAQELVERIAKRAQNFNYEMSENEKEAMAQLLTDIGVMTSDIIDVSRLADNYAINAEIVTPSDYSNYNMREVRQDNLFSWDSDEGKCYCLNW